MSSHHVSARVGGQPVRQRFVRSIGPGGQNARHKATAVELRLDVSRAELPSDAKSRLLAMPGARFTKSGVLVLAARGARSQRENVEAARTRLLELVLQALTPEVRRRRVRPGRESREDRLVDKHRTAERKQSRHARSDE